jgi:hypothetical protein
VCRSFLPAAPAGLLEGFLHGSANHFAVAFHIPDDLMLGQERELRLLSPRVHTTLQ